ncbi:MAG: hypothetical protein Q4B70_09295 [Lachnospiraceae bacterium]|nr:hypothetical protein [Lachnospiraceae bacterium]
MQKNKLPKHFFEENQLTKISTASLTHLRMMTQGFPELYEEVNEVVVPTMNQSRLEQYQREKESILKLTKPEDISK